jgi:molybdopterin converting factor small subunit
VSRVRVEFFGLARSRSGVDAVDLEAATLGDVIKLLTEGFPALAETCFPGGTISSHWLFSLNGREFTRQNSTELADGDVLLLLSADAGG